MVEDAMPENESEDEHLRILLYTNIYTSKRPSVISNKDVREISILVFRCIKIRQNTGDLNFQNTGDLNFKTREISISVFVF